MQTKTAEDLKAQWGYMNVPLNGFALAAGTPLAAFADGASDTPGLNLADSEAFNIRWNNHAAPLAIWTQVSLPADLDEAEPLTVQCLLSKTGATVGDAVTLAIGAYFTAVGDVHNADSNAGGTTSAITGNATTKTIQAVEYQIAAADVPSGARTLSLSITPTAGTLGTDDLHLHSVRIKYRRTNPGIAG